MFSSQGFQGWLGQFQSSQGFQGFNGPIGTVHIAVLLAKKGQNHQKKLNFRSFSK